MESMASIPESAVQGARPLINQADYTQGFELAGGTSLRVQLDSADKSIGSDRAPQQDSSAEEEEEEEEEEEVEDVYWDAQSAVDDEEGEDEDAARRALTFMLAEFGDQLD